MPEGNPESHCAEVHGGINRIDQGITLPDLDAWLYACPYGGSEVGGDLVFLSTCDMGAVQKAYLGDVVGHGAVSAPAARVLRDLVRRHLNDHDHREFFSSINEEAGMDGLMATMVAVSFDRTTSRLVYAYAGHPCILFRPAAGRFEPLQPAPPDALVDLGLGVIPGTQYRQSVTTFSPGDCLVLYSDAWTDAPRDDGTRVGRERFLELVNSCRTDSAAALCGDLLRRFEEEPGARFADDVSLIVMRRPGA